MHLSYIEYSGSSYILYGRRLTGSRHSVKSARPCCDSKLVPRGLLAVMRYLDDSECQQKKRDTRQTHSTRLASYNIYLNPRGRGA